MTDLLITTAITVIIAVVTGIQASRGFPLLSRTAMVSLLVLGMLSFGVAAYFHLGRSATIAFAGGSVSLGLAAIIWALCGFRASPDS